MAMVMQLSPDREDDIRKRIDKPDQVIGLLNRLLGRVDPEKLAERDQVPGICAAHRTAAEELFSDDDFMGAINADLVKTLIGIIESGRDINDVEESLKV